MSKGLAKRRKNQLAIRHTLNLECKKIILDRRIEILIDTSDLDRILRRSWRIYPQKNGRWKIQTNIKVQNKYLTVSLGRYLLRAPKGYIVLHRTNDRFNFMKSNLIAVLPFKLSHCLPKRRIPTSSKFKGVSFNKKNRKWRASIQKDFTTYFLGEFSTELEAARAYDQAAPYFFGNIRIDNGTK
jgi:hypothetical protein